MPTLSPTQSTECHLLGQPQKWGLHQHPPSWPPFPGEKKKKIPPDLQPRDLSLTCAFIKVNSVCVNVFGGLPNAPFWVGSGDQISWKWTFLRNFWPLERLGVQRLNEFHGLWSARQEQDKIPAGGWDQINTEWKWGARMKFWKAAWRWAFKSPNSTSGAG